MMASTKYRGNTEIPRVLRDYAEKRKTNQSEIARAIGRNQSAVAMLFTGYITDNGLPQPYFGMRPFSAGEDPLLLLVTSHLRIPEKMWRKAYEEDMLSWSVEKARREMMKRRQKPEAR